MKTKTTSGGGGSGGGPLPATVKDIENGILTGEIFGIVKCNLRVPPGELTSYFSDFPPIFKNTKIDLKDVGPHMEEYSRSIGRKKGVEMSLISSMFGDGLVILTELFKRYIEMGLVCTDVEWVLEYNPQCVFRWFVDKVSDDRRRADLDDEMAIIGETSKTSGNAAYGYCAICKSRHNTVTFCEQKDLSKHVRDPFFKSVEQLGGGIYEVVKGKRRIIQDTPIQVAIGVYSMAKLRLLEFWKFLKDHLDENMYCLMETDTDSLYIAISKNSLDECVRPDRRAEWLLKKYDYFAPEGTESVLFDGCEVTAKQYGKRTPGLFKLEFSGDGMVALNSKVYHIWGRDDQTGKAVFKTSAKGMQQSRNALIKEDFLSALFDKNFKHTVQNSGFIDEGLRKGTYIQTKKGLNYFYCKRLVLPDGVSTTHLEI